MLDGLVAQVRPISIHAPRTGSDVPAAVILADIRLFQSTLPARGATCPACTRRWTPDHFNPRSPHGERPPPDESWERTQPFQSTLPARGATRRRGTRTRRICISIHAPRTGSDEEKSEVADIRHHFNPRSPHGERPKGRKRPRKGKEISIHAPRTGSDCAK